MKINELILEKDRLYLSYEFIYSGGITSKSYTLIYELLTKTLEGDNHELLFNKEELETLLKDKRINLESFFKRISKKRLEVTFYYRGQFLALVSLPLLNYTIMNDTYVISLTHEVRSLFNYDSAFYELQLSPLLFMKKERSRLLYLKLLDVASRGKSISVTLSELKRIINLDNTYDRFYDFEKNVLIPLFSDINKHLDWQYTYKKIKTGHRITGIQFNLSTINHCVEVEEFFGKIKAYCHDEKEAYDILSKIQNKISKSKLRSLFYQLTLEYSLKKHLPFETFLKTRLKHYNLENNEIIINKRISDPSTIPILISKELEKYDLDSYFDVSFFGYHFFTQLATAKKKTITIEEEKFDIIITYNKHSFTKIQILLKESIFFSI